MTKKLRLYKDYLADLITTCVYPLKTGGSSRGCALVAWNSALCWSKTNRSSDMKLILPLAVSAGGPSRGAALVWRKPASEGSNMWRASRSGLVWSFCRKKQQ
jgi:hypothetical protein